MPLSVLIFAVVLCSIVLLLFYRMEVTIQKEQLRVVFGIGLIKRIFYLNDIDKKSLEIKRIPFFFGAGIRYTPDGLLYNVGSGKALKFKIKNTKKGFLIGSKKPTVLQSFLNNYKLS